MTSTNKKFLKKRKWVNAQLKKRAKKQKGVDSGKLLKELWREANLKFK